MFHLALHGIWTVHNILLTFILIGIITALWRACGTIPFIVYHAAALCSASSILVITFLLCSLISVLTGTSFGTAATMGVICMTIARSMGVPVIYIGGAILSGIYFGDRCSPMSTSALLVSTLTHTNIFTNIRIMLRTAAIPFILTLAAYLVLGWTTTAVPAATDVQAIFASNFHLHPAMLLPALIIVLFSLFKIDVKRTMSLSIFCSLLVAYFIEALAPLELIRIALWGYQPANPELAALLSGGGIFSMRTVFTIVCLSSSFAGMFAGTHFLDGIQQQLSHLGRRITPFGSIIFTSILTSMIACNQTLAVMLTYQLCQNLDYQPEELAPHLENTAVVISPLVPWSIAGAVPLAAVAAPSASILIAFYLFFLPAWNFLVELRKSKTA